MTSQEAAPPARQYNDIRRALTTLGYIAVPTTITCGCETFRRPETPNHPVVLHQCDTWTNEPGSRRQGVLEVRE